MKKLMLVFMAFICLSMMACMQNNNSQNENQQDNQQVENLPVEEIDPEALKNLELYPPTSVSDLSRRIIGTTWLAKDYIKFTIEADSSVTIHFPVSELRIGAGSFDSDTLDFEIPYDLAHFKVEKAGNNYRVKFYDIYKEVLRCIVFNNDTPKIELISTTTDSYSIKEIRQVF